MDMAPSWSCDQDNWTNFYSRILRSFYMVFELFQRRCLKMLTDIGILLAHPWAFALGKLIKVIFMLESRKFCQGVFLSFFLADEEIENPNTTINGPSSARQRNTIQMAGRWLPNIEWWLCSFVIFQGILTSIAFKETLYFLWFFEGGQNPLSPPPLDLPMIFSLIPPWKKMLCSWHWKLWYSLEVSWWYPSNEYHKEYIRAWNIGAYCTCVHPHLNMHLQVLSESAFIKSQIK